MGIVNNYNVYDADMQIVSPAGRAREPEPDREPSDAKTMLPGLAWLQGSVAIRGS
jgi:hypothetical protein